MQSEIGKTMQSTNDHKHHRRVVLNKPSDVLCLELQGLLVSACKYIEGCAALGPRERMRPYLQVSEPDPSPLEMIVDADRWTAALPDQMLLFADDRI